MRLPTLYETEVADPGGSDKPTDASPTFNAANGIPSALHWTWTASSFSSLTNSYWAWTNVIANSPIKVSDTLYRIHWSRPGDVGNTLYEVTEIQVSGS